MSHTRRRSVDRRTDDVGAIDREVRTLVGGIETEATELRESADPAPRAAVDSAELYVCRGGHPPSDRPLLLVQHIPKTAGTSLRDVVRRNHDEFERHEVQDPTSKPHAEASSSELLRWYAALYEWLTPDQRSMLVCVAARDANCLLRVAEGPVLVASLIRDPVDRVLSLFLGRRVPSERPNLRWELSLRDIYGRIAEMSPEVIERDVSFSAVHWFNGQARSILAPHFDTSSLAISRGPGQDADVWRECLFSIVDRHYMLGPTEDVDGFVTAMAERFGWSDVSTPRLNVNTGRVASSMVSQDVLDVIADYNWLDIELHQRVVSQWGSSSSAGQRAERTLPESAAVLAGAGAKSNPEKARRKQDRAQAEWIKKAKQATGKGSNLLELYVADEALPPDEPLIFFQHTPKTAGTSLNTIIRSNYVSPDRPGIRHFMIPWPERATQTHYRGWSRDFISTLSEQTRRSIVCVSGGQGTNQFAYLLGRPLRGMTILRDPLDRVMSRYFYSRGRGRGVLTPEVVSRELREIYGSMEWRRKINGLDYFNGQSRQFLGPLFDVEGPPLECSRGPTPEGERWRDRLFELLDDHYIVGLQDRFDESVAVFAQEFGWHETAAPRRKFNRVRPRGHVEDEELKTMILEYNWLDRELYDRFARAPIGRMASSSR